MSDLPFGLTLKSFVQHVEMFKDKWEEVNSQPGTDGTRTHVALLTVLTNIEAQQRRKGIETRSEPETQKCVAHPEMCNNLDCVPCAREVARNRPFRATEEEERRIGNWRWRGEPDHLDFIEHLHMRGEIPELLTGMGFSPDHTAGFLFNAKTAERFVHGLSSEEPAAQEPRSEPIIQNQIIGVASENLLAGQMIEIDPDTGKVRAAQKNREEEVSSDPYVRMSCPTCVLTLDAGEPVGKLFLQTANLPDKMYECDRYDHFMDAATIEVLCARTNTKNDAAESETRSEPITQNPYAHDHGFGEVCEPECPGNFLLQVEKLVYIAGTINTDHEHQHLWTQANIVEGLMGKMRNFGAGGAHLSDDYVDDVEGETNSTQADTESKVEAPRTQTLDQSVRIVIETLEESAREIGRAVNQAIQNYEKNTGQQTKRNPRNDKFT